MIVEIIKLLQSMGKVSVLRVVLVLISPQLDRIRRDTRYLSLFSLNTGKYGPEKFRTRILFT